MSEFPPARFWSTPLPLPDLPLPATVAGDLPCRRCGYNLRTLASGALCPECATPVVLSMSGDRLRFSDPRWLQKLRIGVLCLIAGWIVSLLFGGLPIVVLHQLFMMPQTLLFWLSGAYGLVARPIVQVLFLAGAWLVSIPEPSGFDIAGMWRWRRVLRLLIVIQSAELPVAWMLQNALPSFAISPAMYQVAASIWIASEIIPALGHLALFNYIARLYLRIPDRFLSRSCQALGYLLGVTSSLDILAFMPILMFSPRGGWAPIYRMWAHFTNPFLLVLNVLALLLLQRFSAALKEEYLTAKQTWQSGKPPIHGV